VWEIEMMKVFISDGNLFVMAFLSFFPDPVIEVQGCNIGKKIRPLN
jgi:hypothetical protein